MLTIGFVKYYVLHVYINIKNLSSTAVDQTKLQSKRTKIALVYVCMYN